MDEGWMAMTIEMTNKTTGSYEKDRVWTIPIKHHFKWCDEMKREKKLKTAWFFHPDQHEQWSGMSILALVAGWHESKKNLNKIKHYTTQGFNLTGKMVFTAELADRAVDSEA
ncbi:hypothetical protein EV421DRAFT_1743177 [Armillaria borealis]|uniref:Uncharacterized protein n=1 Tax=Armillaria borealis TaxID=47425 RepID=A0AA39MDZ9_9AGAR|nr:hypothetical protein EV421DRAFT_1743177 [Armillaria borealis]